MKESNVIANLNSPQKVNKNNEDRGVLSPEGTGRNQKSLSRDTDEKNSEQFTDFENLNKELETGENNNLNISQHQNYNQQEKWSFPKVDTRQILRSPSHRYSMPNPYKPDEEKKPSIINSVRCHRSLIDRQIPLSSAQNKTERGEDNSE